MTTQFQNQSNTCDWAPCIHHLIHPRHDLTVVCAECMLRGRAIDKLHKTITLRSSRRLASNYLHWNGCAQPRECAFQVAFLNPVWQVTYPQRLHLTFRVICFRTAVDVAIDCGLVQVSIFKTNTYISIVWKCACCTPPVCKITRTRVSHSAGGKRVGALASAWQSSCQPGPRVASVWTRTCLVVSGKIRSGHGSHA